MKMYKHKFQTTHDMGEWKNKLFIICHFPTSSQEFICWIIKYFNKGSSNLSNNGIKHKSKCFIQIMNVITDYFIE